MNYFDIIFAAILLYSAYKGFSKGIVIQAASLIALLLGIFGAIKFSDVTSGFLQDKFQFDTQYLPLISFALTFVAIVIGVHLIARIIDKLMKAVALGFLNRLSGLAFAVLKMAFIISIVLVIVNNADKKFNFMPKEKIQDSLLYKPLSNFAPFLFPYLKFNDIKDTFEDTIEPFDFTEEDEADGVKT